MKSFKDLLNEKPKKGKKFSVDQINKILIKVGVKPSMVVAAINALNAARGIGLVEGGGEIRIKEAIDFDPGMPGWLQTAFDKYNDLMEHMAKVNIRDDQIAKEWKKVDKAFDNIIKISNKKGYFKK